MTQAVLKLNAGFVPFETCSPIEAVKLLFKERGTYALENRATFFRTSSAPYPVPSVIVIPSLRFIPARTVVFSSLNVMYRDDQTCQYCGARLPIDELELDHVIPRSRFARIARERGLRFGKTSWENCVAACTPCNRRKADSLCEDVGLFPRHVPARPKFRPNIVISSAEAEAKGWLPYLAPFNGRYVRLVD